jgi:hypothetical protein
MTDSRNRQRARALRADASLEAKVAFVAEGIRTGRIPVDLVERAAMVGNETAMAVFPDASGLLNREHSRARAISDYLLEDRPDMLNVVLVCAARIIRDGIRSSKIKLGNKSIPARVLWYALHDRYPVRVEDYQDIENHLVALVNEIEEEHWAEGFYARPVSERARVIWTSQILRATLLLWDVAGFYWGYIGRLNGLEGLFVALNSILYRRSTSTHDSIKIVCDALMGLPYGR